MSQQGVLRRAARVQRTGNGSKGGRKAKHGQNRALDLKFCRDCGYGTKKTKRYMEVHGG